MITNDAPDEQQQQRETSNGEAATSLQVVVPANNHSIVRGPLSLSSDESSASEDEDDGKQVTVVGSQAPTENGNRIISTFNECTNVTSTVNNTTIYEDGVTVINNVYCCSASLGHAFKRLATKRKLIIFVALLSGALLFICLGLWISNLATSYENIPVISTTEKEAQSTTIAMPSSSTTTTVIPASSSTDSSSSTSESPNNEWRIIKRQDWKAAPATYPPVELTWLPPLYVIFSETETAACITTQECMETVRNIQTAHMNDGADDIGYNFLIGDDGMVYEGRGWDVTGSVKDYDTRDFDDMSISVSFIGEFDNDVPTEIILRAAKRFLTFGSQIEKLHPSPRLKCLRQLSYTITNPGDKLYDIIKTWKGWDPRTIEYFPPVQNYIDYHSFYANYSNSDQSAINASGT